MIPTRRGLMAGVLPLIAACETSPSRPPRSPALPPPRATGPSEPAPMPSDVTDDFIAARRGALTPAPVGADAMPGFGPAQRVGTDMMTAPIPGEGILPRR